MGVTTWGTQLQKDHIIPVTEITFEDVVTVGSYHPRGWENMEAGVTVGSYNPLGWENTEG